MTKFILSAGALLLCIFCISAAAAQNGWLPKEKPPYCNAKPEKSAIPPLTPAENDLVESLEQVQVMIRHGSRTPWGPEPCWKYYDIQWSDCNITELMVASTAKKPYNSDKIPEPWLFRKVYNAFTNQLGGLNCFTGQLLKEGYDQEQENGRILKKAYLQQTGDDTNLNLWSTDKWADISKKTTDTFFRSDDEQRTLMSGQTLLSTFFDLTRDGEATDTIESIVAWHTGDEALDQIAPNPTACPALTYIQQTNYASAAFTAQNTSAAVQGMTNQLDAILGAGTWTWYNVIDCFMTAVCNDYPIPNNPDTGAAMTEKLFNDTIANVAAIYSFNMNNDASRFAKLAMGHTIYEMRTRLEKALNGDDDAMKFGLWSAHDTSVMPLLSALLQDPNDPNNNLWDGVWAQYASLVSIELYKAKAGGFLFRMLYNGDVLRLPACDTDLCDVNVLTNAMAYAQENMPCDAINPPPSPDNETTAEDTVDGMNSGEWIGVCIGNLIIGVLVGVVISRYMNKRPLCDHEKPLLDDASTSGHQDLVASSKAVRNPQHINV